MKLEDQVTNLELSKKLKKLGVKQESIFYWSKPISDNGQPNGGYFVNWKESSDFCDDDSHDHKLVSAFTVAELGEMLPLFVGNGLHRGRFVLEQGIGKEKWKATYVDSDGGRFANAKNDKNMANTCAELLIYLIENNLSNN